MPEAFFDGRRSILQTEAFPLKQGCRGRRTFCRASFPRERDFAGEAFGYSAREQIVVQILLTLIARIPIGIMLLNEADAFARDFIIKAPIHINLYELAPGLIIRRISALMVPCQNTRSTAPRL
jgi:hypothetical protein